MLYYSSQNMNMKQADSTKGPTQLNEQGVYIDNASCKYVSPSHTPPECF